MNETAIEAELARLEGLAVLLRTAHNNDAWEFINKDHVDTVLARMGLTFTHELMRDELAADRALMEASEEFNVENVPDEYYDDEYKDDDTMYDDET